MSWLVRVVVDSQEVEVLISRFWDAGTNGVAELPAPDDSPNRCQLVAGFESEEAAVAASKLHDGCSVEPLDPNAWSGPAPAEIRVGGQTIVIDADHAFGHGGHPTTELVLETLGALIGPGESFLDVGTGSGILAIAAKKLGADTVLAVDNDPAALLSAGSNAMANDVVFEITDTPLAELVSESEPFDLVVANMLLADLRPLAPSVVCAVGGTLVVSGCLEEQVDELLTYLAPLRPISRLERDGWACVVLR